MRRAWPLLALAGCTVPGAPARPPPADSAAPSPPPPPTAEPAPGDPFASSPPCSADDACGWARCNTRAGRCSFPCATDADCSADARCLPAPANPDVLVCAAP